MKKIYLHMGFSKTASTSFQLTCKENIDSIKSAGFAYPFFNSSAIINASNDIENHGTCLYSLFCENAQYFVGNLRWKISDFELLHKDYSLTLDNCLLKNDKVIISGERISSFKVYELNKLKTFLSKYDAEIVPFAIIRSPYEHHCSMHQQAIKGGFIDDFTQWASQITFIDNIKKVFPNTEFYPFRRTLEHKFGPSGFLFEKIGINCDNFNFINSNEGWPNTLTRLQQVENKKEPCFIDGILTEDFLQQVLNKQEAFIINAKINEKFRHVPIVSTTCFKSKFYLTKEEFEKIKDDLEKENKFFDEVLGEGFKDTSIKFSDTNNMLEEIAHYFLEVNDRNAKANQAAATEQSLHSKQEIISCQMLSIVKFFVKSKYLLFLMLTKLTFSKVQKFKDKLKKIEQILVSIQK